jgi:hypothetical protein
VTLLLLPLLPTPVGAFAVMIKVRRVSAHRLGEVVGLLVVAMTLSLALVAGSTRELQQAMGPGQLVELASRVRSPWSPAEWLTQGLIGAATGDTAGAVKWFGLALLVAAGAFAPVFATAERLYYGGWAHMQSTDRRREAKGGRMPWSRVDRAEELSTPSGWLARLPQPTVAVFRKDARVIPRDLTNLAQVLSPLAIGVFFVLQQLLYPVRVGGTRFPQPYLAPLLAMLSAALATGVAAMITARFGLTAFSAEGRAHWIVKAAPISRNQVLAAKWLVAYVPYLAIGLSLVVLLEVARAVSDARLIDAPLATALTQAWRPELLLYGWFVVAVLGAGVIALTLALGTSRPNLRWDSPHEMLTPDIGCLSLVLYLSYVLVAGPALALPLAVGQFPVIEHRPVLWALGLFVGLGVTAAVVAGAWRLALLELDRVGD